jgi:thiol-disulfide isomerase/thioredoxin
MRNYFLCILFLLSLAGPVSAQTGYHLKFNFKNCKDSTLYLARYFFDQMPISDSCKNVANGKFFFKGDMPLEKGVYFLANQSRTSYYCQFIVDDNQNFNIQLDGNAVATSLKSDDKQNELFFSYIRFMTGKNKELNDYRVSLKGKPAADSLKLSNDKQLKVSTEMQTFDKDFMLRTKGQFVHDLMNLKAEKYAPSVPLASNGRPDSVYSYYYYKSHYFEGVNWKDERLLLTPFLAEKVKNYFEHLVPSHPDSVIKELDNILMKCTPGGPLFNTLVGHFTYKYEQDKAMSFDNQGRSQTFEKVFIHLADHYIVNGKTDGYYSAETVVKIKERVDVLRNLLPGTKVANLYMVDTLNGAKVRKMGFDTASSSESVTKLYQANIDRLRPLFKPLTDLKSKYTVLVFWAADCGHCKTEVPKLHKELQALNGTVNYSVYAVQTKEELLDSWKALIVEKNLSGWTHVFDPIHLNNLKDQFDIVATPVVYLLDKDKRIIAKKIAADQVVEIIRMLEKIESDNKKIKG